MRATRAVPRLSRSSLYSTQSTATTRRPRRSISKRVPARGRFPVGTRAGRLDPPGWETRGPARATPPRRSAPAAPCHRSIPGCDSAVCARGPPHISENAPRRKEPDRSPMPNAFAHHTLFSPKREWGGPARVRPALPSRPGIRTSLTAHQQRT